MTLNICMVITDIKIGEFKYISFILHQIVLKFELNALKITKEHFKTKI